MYDYNEYEGNDAFKSSGNTYIYLYIYTCIYICINTYV
jgi:hypothetical protein